MEELQKPDEIHPEAKPAANDHEHPRSVYNLVPYSFQWEIDKIPPGYFLMDERELETRVKTEHRDQFQTLSRLRIAFWEEYDRCQDNCVPMNMTAVAYGVIQYRALLRTFKDPLKAMYILTPPVNYMLAMKDALSRITRRIYEIAELPITLKICRCHWECICKRNKSRKKQYIAPSANVCSCAKGCICPEKPNTKAASVILDAYKNLEMRVHGAVVQKIKQETTSLNMHLSAKSETKALPMPNDAHSIDEKLSELENRVKALSPPSVGVEVLGPGQSQVKVIDVDGGTESG